MKFILPQLIFHIRLLLFFVDGKQDGYHGMEALVDSIMDFLEEDANSRRLVERYCDIVVGGHGHASSENDTGSVKISPLLQPSYPKVHHKTHPPVLGSLCDYQAYTKLFSRYYSLPYLRREDRLFEHKAIETALQQGMEASQEFAYSVCQFGGIQMECGEQLHCICLNESPPFHYEEGDNGDGMTCLGNRGSMCTNDTRASIDCMDDLNCTEGYCGGLRTAARVMLGIDTGNFLNLSIWCWQLQMLIVTISIFSIT